MTHRILKLFLILLCATLPARADLNDTEDWKSAAQVREVRSMVFFQGQVVAGTPRGGLLLLDPSGGAVDFFNSGDGLTSDAVSDLAVDDQGNLWVATGGEGVSAAGLCRLDPSYGVRPVAQDLASNEVVSIASDGDFLYYGTRLDGAGRLSGGLPEAIYNTSSSGLSSDQVVHVAAHGGVAWFATQSGVDRLANNVIAPAIDGLELNIVRDLLAGPSGAFAADREGVKRWDSNNSRWESHGQGLADSVRALAFDGDDLIALGWVNQAWRLPAGSNQWQSQTLNITLRNYYSLAASGDGHVWYGGKQVDTERTLQGQRALLYEPDTDRSVVQFRILGEDVQNLEPDGQGGYWVSCLAPWNGLSHWRADGSFVSYDYDQETAGFGWCANRTKFGLALDRRGDLWVSNFRACITRLRPSSDDDPRTAEYLELTVADSPLRLLRTREIVEDPQGRIWFLSDGEAADEGLGIDILEDPTAPFEPTSWRALSPSNSLLRDGWVRSVEFEGRGTAWISIEGVGVQRWDYDGIPDDGVMRESQFLSNAAWDRIPYDGASAAVDFSEPRQVAIGPNGLIYIAAADKGVLEVEYRPFFVQAEDRISFRRIFRGGQAGSGLLSSNASGAVFDEEGKLWAASAVGLNRLDVLADDLSIDAWTTIEAYQTFQLQLSGYLGDVLSPMAGADLQKLRFDPVSQEVAMGSISGITRVQSAVGVAPPPSVENFDFQLYPNPFPGRSGEAQGVQIAGIEGEGSIIVTIFDLQGVPIEKGIEIPIDELESTPVWDGNTLNFEPAASGLYIIQVSWQGETANKVLAVER